MAVCNMVSDDIIERIFKIRFDFTSGSPIYLLKAKKGILGIGRNGYKTEKLSIEYFETHWCEFNFPKDVRMLLTREEYVSYIENRNDPKKLNDVLARAREDTPYRYAMLLGNFYQDGRTYSAIWEDIKVKDCTPAEF